MKKTIIKESLVGFTLGITLLMLAYISIYFIVGNEAFINEISQLQNINTLISQLLVIGIAYSIIIIISHVYLESADKYAKEKPYKYVLITFLVLFVYFIAMCVVSIPKIYSESIASLNCFILVMIYIINIIHIAIKTFKDCKCVKEINQKLKERNNK